MLLIGPVNVFVAAKVNVPEPVLYKPMGAPLVEFKMGPVTK